MFLFIINSHLSKADGIYYLRDSLGIENINKIDSLHIVIRDSISFDYVLSDSTRSYKIYAAAPLYDLVNGEIRIISKGFDVKFANVKELILFLFNICGIQIKINNNYGSNQQSITGQRATISHR